MRSKWHIAVILVSALMMLLSVSRVGTGLQQETVILDGDRGIGAGEPMDDVRPGQVIRKNGRLVVVTDDHMRTGHLLHDPSQDILNDTTWIALGGGGLLMLNLTVFHWALKRRQDDEDEDEEDDQESELFTGR